MNVGFVGLGRQGMADALAPFSSTSGYDVTGDVGRAAKRSA